MKKAILLLSICAVAFSACEKENSDTTPAGVIRFSNNSEFPYRVYIDGSNKTDVPGKQFKEYNISKGTYKMKAEQLAGYALYPTIKEAVLTVNEGGQAEFIFP